MVALSRASKSELIFDHSLFLFHITMVFFLNFDEFERNEILTQTIFGKEK